jgi:hypothetical protein
MARIEIAAKCINMLGIRLKLTVYALVPAAIALQDSSGRNPGGGSPVWPSVVAFTHMVEHESSMEHGAASNVVSRPRYGRA